MDKTCPKCKIECKAEQTFVICEAFCVGMSCFHVKCVGLSDDEGKACSLSKRNIAWMCGDCKDLIENLKFRATVNKVRSIQQPLETRVEQLKAEVEKIGTRMDELLETTKCRNNTKEIIPVEIVEEPKSSFSRSISPLSSTRLSKNQETGPRYISDSPLQLHVSNISNDVTEEEVLQMVTDAIGVEEVLSIECLVPKWKDRSTLDFISFKVKIDENYRRVALKRSNWPKEVRCREFIEFGNTTWTPLRL